MMKVPNRTLIMAFLAFLAVLLPCAAEAQQKVAVTLVTDEAESVLAALDKRAKNQDLAAEDYASIFSSEGYKRLKARELSLGRSFEESDFKVFLNGEELLKRREVLRHTLQEWSKTDFEVLGSRVLGFLPDSAYIRAKVYPVIKPATNSFVFDLSNDPAIFLYLDENLSKAAFQNTVAHELHHIGFGTACPGEGVEEQTKMLSGPQQKVLRWTGAFGEGLAMLAAAGGSQKHPHLTSSAADRTRWDRDVDNFDSDLKKVESFFLDLLSGKLTPEAELDKARSFYGIQGPWYTVGWKMAAVIEDELGRETLIECFCDGRKLLPGFNRAAASHSKRTGEKIAVWDENLVSDLARPIN